MHNTLTWCTHKRWSTYSYATTRIKITHFFYIWNNACTTPTRPAKHKTIKFPPHLRAGGCYMHLFTNLLTVFHSTVSGDLYRASGLAHFCSHLITSSNVQLTTTHLSSVRHSQTHALCGPNLNLTTVLVFGKSKLS